MSNENFTLMSDAAIEQMTQLWVSQKLPRQPDFKVWSQEYAREVWKAVQWFKDEPQIELILFLERMSVWDPNVEEQQWVPRDWTPVT